MERITKEFKLSGKGLIVTECLVSKGNEEKGVLGDPIKLKALWDTGANFCHISTEKSEQLGLRSIGKESYIKKEGIVNMNFYVINVHFSATWIEPVIAFEGTPHGYDFLIGMDLLLRGNFSIKATRDGFVFSFEKI